MIPVISFVGASGSGKTTLIEKLVSYLSKSGFKVGTIKHTHHDVEFDKKGKDSHRHFHAGAISSMVISPNIIGYTSKIVTNDITFVIEKFFYNCDLIIIEGFKDDDTKKIEVYRSSISHRPLYSSLKNVVAVATDRIFDDIPCLNLNDIEEIASFVLTELALDKEYPPTCKNV